jgi:hypothetical protein
LLDVFDYVMPDVVPATAAETPAEMNMTPNSKRLKMSYPVNSSQHSNSSIGQHFSSLMEDNFFASIYLLECISATAQKMIGCMHQRNQSCRTYPAKKSSLQLNTIRMFFTT